MKPKMATVNNPTNSHVTLPPEKMNAIQNTVNNPIDKSTKSLSQLYVVALKERLFTGAIEKGKA
jgi:hypothetical protein